MKLLLQVYFTFPLVLIFIGTASFLSKQYGHQIRTELIGAGAFWLLILLMTLAAYALIQILHAIWSA